MANLLIASGVGIGFVSCLVMVVQAVMEINSEKSSRRRAAYKEALSAYEDIECELKNKEIDDVVKTIDSSHSNRENSSRGTRLASSENRAEANP